MFNGLIRHLDSGIISKKYASKVIDTLISGAFLGEKGRDEACAEYERKHGIRPPALVAISPTKMCNLNCIGCYASSTAESTEKLEWDILEKLVQQLHDMGMRFFVISGGEPLMYKSQGHSILDLPRKFNDSFFLMYTNGTLITDQIAQQMEDLGNITPAISTEGFEKETDERRGKGIQRRLLEAMAILRNHGVMFGVSVTSTKQNIEVLLSDKFYDFYFKDQGATYMWMFQYMPIGRKFTTDLMLDPEQRLALFKKWQQQINDKRYFVADFWNSGVLCSGCISCSREGGYFYIDWNGNIMPCVFIPYYQDNVKDLFKKGKRIEEALFSDLFTKGREWQMKYFNNKGKVGNMLMPCLMRDHHKDIMGILKGIKNLKPEDECAKQALASKDYHKKLIEFDERLEKIMEPVWKKEYE